MLHILIRYYPDLNWKKLRMKIALRDWCATKTGATQPCEMFLIKIKSINILITTKFREKLNGIFNGDVNGLAVFRTVPYN